MTQDEVDLIYDYLHENYRYEHGELIIKKIMKGRPLGKRLGVIIDSCKKPHILATIYINKIKYTKPLSAFIFIYHKKYLPKYISHLDNNPFNYNIDNLLESSRKWSDYDTKSHKGYYTKKTKNGVVYVVQIKIKEIDGHKSVYLGKYKTEKKASDIYCNAKTLLKDKNITKQTLLEKLNLNIKKNKSTYPVGVYKRISRYRAVISINGKNKYLGSFITPEEAHEAYLKAKKELQSK